MTILSLRDNRIVRIPDDIGRMPNLQVINLACNRSVFQFMKIYFSLSGTINLLFLNTLLVGGGGGGGGGVGRGVLVYSLYGQGSHAP